jgi:hypothetical protein
MSTFRKWVLFLVLSVAFVLGYDLALLQVSLPREREAAKQQVLIYEAAYFGWYCG